MELLINGILENLEKNLQEEHNDKQELMELFDKLPFFVCFKDEHGNWLDANQYAKELLGLNDIDIQGKTDAVLMGKRSDYEWSECIQSDEEVWTLGKTVRSEEVIYLPDGQRKILDVLKYPVFNPDGTRKRLQVFGRDITDQRAAEGELKETTHLLADFKAALDESAIVAVTDRKGIITYVNDKFCTISGFSSNELIGVDHRIVNSGYHSKTFFRQMWKTISSGEVWVGEVQNKAKDGRIYWMKTTIVPFKNHQGKPYQYVSIRTDITSQKQTELYLKKIALYDDLTGLPNRRYFRQYIDEQLDIAEASNQKLALFWIDMNRFKFVNENIGHATGDLVLQRVGNRLKKEAQMHHMVARLGGDQFAILTLVSDFIEAKVIAETLLERLKKPLWVAGNELRLSASVGVALFPDHGGDNETLMKSADKAMYHAKQQGGSNYKLFASQMNTDRKMIKLENDLYKAIEREELFLCYQAQVDMITGKITGVEALVRWQHPELGLIPPGQFIPIAEETNLIIQLGEWTLEKACAQHQNWQKEGLPPLQVAVNLSAKQFSQENLAERIRRIIEKTKMNPRYLELEITEYVSMENVEQTIETLHQLKNIGVQISIDDFGTGYSSLGYLKSFPVDTLKIDQSFVREIEMKKSDEAIVYAIISMAKHLDLTVVAEGVETSKQWELLRQGLCTKAQGYYIGKPLPILDLTKFQEIQQHILTKITEEK